jgi:hypothetical protein
MLPPLKVNMSPQNSAAMNMPPPTTVTMPSQNISNMTMSQRVNQIFNESVEKSGNLTKNSITSNGNVQHLPYKHSDHCENSRINTCITSSASTQTQITETTITRSNPSNNTGADKQVAHVLRARNRSVRR